MDIQEYISSGILELYVYGALTENESEEVSEALLKNNEVRTEVEEIEGALQSLARATAPYSPEKIYASIKNNLQLPNVQTGRVVPIKATSKRDRIVMYISLAASVALLIGVFSLLSKNNELQQNLNKMQVEQGAVSSEVETAKSQLTETQNDLNETQNLLNIFRDQEVIKIPLAGQKVSPDAFVNVFWDKRTNKTYIDAQGLPEPPEGMVYQVWSLKLNPLAPTSIGLLDNFNDDQNKIFELNNPNESEAFGITLEPAGGSKAPTMEQLYTLGALSS